MSDNSDNLLKHINIQRDGNRSRSRLSRSKRLFIAGMVFGLLGGVLAAGGVSAWRFHDYAGNAEDRELELRAEIEDLQGENEHLTNRNTLSQIEGSKTEIAEINAELLGGDEAWNLVLINETHPLATDYEPASLTEIEPDRSVDSRIAGALQKMMKDGEAQGLHMYVTSAYRSYERQREVFNAGLEERLRTGLSPLEAYEDTRRSIAYPGTSEHASGLAVDIIAEGYSELDEEQASTPEQQWLMEHCWEYGFILRYPDGTGDITGIIFEPWHYRYVGVTAAREITEQGITLEEYLD